MYLIIGFFIISILIIFIVYQFFPKIDSIIKKYLPSQRVIDIKSDMKSLDNNINITKTDSINDKLDNIIFMPIEYLYRSFNYLFSQLPLRIP